MKKILGCFAVLAAVCFTGSMAQASGLCTANIGQNVLSGGFFCTAGGLTFSNFSSNTNSPQGVTLSASSGTTITLSPNLPTPSSPGPAMDDIDLWFKVSGGISGVGASINGNSSAFVTERVCDSAGLASPASGGICVNAPGLAFITAFGGHSAVSSSPFTTTDPVWIFKDINDGGGAVSELTQIYTTTSTVPEPMTLSMMGAGLLGLSFISRRRKKS